MTQHAESIMVFVNNVVYQQKPQILAPGNTIIMIGKHNQLIRRIPPIINIKLFVNNNKQPQATKSCCLCLYLQLIYTTSNNNKSWCTGVVYSPKQQLQVCKQQQTASGSKHL